MTESVAIEVSLNGAPQMLPETTTIAQLLQQAGLGERRVAVECNGAIVPRSLHAQTRLHSGDRIELVQAIGGG